MADPAPAPSGAGTPATHAPPELRVVKDGTSPEASTEVAVSASRPSSSLIEKARTVVSALDPPDLVHTPPPSLQQLWNRAREARHLPDSSWLRAIATANVIVFASCTLVAVLCAWATQSPARGAVLTLVAGCAVVLAFLTLSAL